LNISQVHISEALRLGKDVVDELRHKIDALDDKQEKERLYNELEKESASVRSSAESFSYVS